MVKLDRSGGCVDRSKKARAQSRARRINAYFYGEQNQLLPASVTLDIHTSSTIAAAAAAAAAAEEAGGDAGTEAPEARKSDISVFSVGGQAAAALALEAALPIGAMAGKEDHLKLDKVVLGDDPIVHHVVAVVYGDQQPAAAAAAGQEVSSAAAADAAKGFDESVRNGCAAGFVFVQSLDAAKGKITVMSPSPGPLPSKTLVMGNILWLE